MNAGSTAAACEEGDGLRLGRQGSAPLWGTERGGAPIFKVGGPEAAGRLTVGGIAENRQPPESPPAQERTPPTGIGRKAGGGGHHGR